MAATMCLSIAACGGTTPVEGTSATGAAFVEALSTSVDYEASDSVTELVHQVEPEQAVTGQIISVSPGYDHESLDLRTAVIAVDTDDGRRLFVDILGPQTPDGFSTAQAALPVRATILVREPTREERADMTPVTGTPDRLDGVAWAPQSIFVDTTTDDGKTVVQQLPDGSLPELSGIPVTDVTDVAEAVNREIASSQG
ncbi:MAG: hypothetical protein U0R64_05155 [Candidatus Nanopelagicales bacterium]